MGQYAQDWWLTPIEITTSNNVFRIVENSIARTATLAAGTYYQHRDSTYHAGGYLSLFLALETALNATATNDYTFRPCTPTSSPNMQAAGVEIVTTDALTFTLDFTNAGNTLPAKYLGWDSTDTAAAAKSHKSKKCAYGRWCSRTIVMDEHAAVRKRSFAALDIAFSHDYPRDRYPLEWDDYRVRTIRYEYVQAAHIHERGANTMQQASWAGIGFRDGNNAFETVWRSMMRSEKIIIAHDRALGTWDGTLTTNSEVIQTLGLEPDFESVAQEIQANGELYRLNLRLWIEPTQLVGYLQ